MNINANNGIAGENGLIPLSFGPIVCLVKREEAFVYYATYIAGEWDFLNINRGDIVLDAGANIGDFALKAALAVGSRGRVIAVEPAPESYAILQRNILINGFKNIICQRKALWDQDAVLCLRESGVASRVGEGGTSPVEATTIDSLIKELALDHIDIVKMDIEGAEANAIKNGAFLRRVREIAVEVHGVQNRGKLIEILRERAFSIKTFTSLDLIRNVLVNSTTHLANFLEAERKTRFIASKSFITTFLNPESHAVPACKMSSGLNIIYGRFEGGS